MEAAAGAFVGGGAFVALLLFLLLVALLLLLLFFGLLVASFAEGAVMGTLSLDAGGVVDGTTTGVPRFAARRFARLAAKILLRRARRSAAVVFGLSVSPMIQ